MKINILLCLALFFSYISYGQVFSVDPIEIDAQFGQVDLTDNYVDLSKYTSVENLTGDSIFIKWEREVPEECPDAWDTQICDNLKCYGFATGTNFDPPAVDEPFALAPFEGFDSFALHVWPRMVSGCCQIKVHFSLVDEPDEILETALFNVKVNDPDCDPLSSIDEKAQVAKIRMFPNPATTSFALTDNELIRQVVIFNILGKQMKIIEYQNGRNFDISILPDGLYLVGLQDEEGNTLKTMRLSKRGIMP